MTVKLDRINQFVVMQFDVWARKTSDWLIFIFLYNFDKSWKTTIQAF